MDQEKQKEIEEFCKSLGLDTGVRKRGDLVEESLRINIGDFRRGEFSWDKDKTNIERIQKKTEGVVLVFGMEVQPTPVSYRIEIGGSETELFLEYPWRGRQESSYLEVRYASVGYGERPYFVCPGCWEQYTGLYLLDRGVRCRRCADLRYASSAVRKSSPIGRYKHSMFLYLKLGDLRYALRRPWYRGKPTRKAQRYADLSAKYEVLSHRI